MKLLQAVDVTEQVPYGQPVEWCHRMVITRKHDGSARRTVDLSPLNKHCKRKTFSSESPFQIARRVPGDTWKTVTDAWNGFHGMVLREEDRHLTTFITPLVGGGINVLHKGLFRLEMDTIGSLMLCWQTFREKKDV